MEFLLTYGWAVVVLVTALVALSYYGVLDPVGLAIKYMPSSCHIDTGLSCLDHQVYIVPGENWPFIDSNNLKLRIKNNLGYSAHIIRVRILDEWGYDETMNNELGAGEESIVTIDDITYVLVPGSTNPSYEPGTPYTKNLIITVKNDETQLEHNMRAYIRGTVA